MGWEVGVINSGYWNDDFNQGGPGRASRLWLQAHGGTFVSSIGLSSIQVDYYQDGTKLGSVIWSSSNETFGGINFSNINSSTLSARAVYNGQTYQFAVGRSGGNWVSSVTLDSTSPLVIDLNGDGLQTFGLEQPVLFDLNADGALERTGWLDSYDGFLVLDRNGDGLIGSGAELFGNHTRLADGTEAESGWQALQQYDLNLDQEINSGDTIFGQLQVWIDRNRDGVSDAGELLSLSEAQIHGISLMHDGSRTEQNGNILDGLATVVRSDGTTTTMTDVWFTVAEDIGASEPTNDSIIGSDFSGTNVSPLLSNDPLANFSSQSTEQSVGVAPMPRTLVNAETAESSTDQRILADLMLDLPTVPAIAAGDAPTWIEPAFNAHGLMV